MRYAFMADTQLPAGLRAFRNFDLVRLFERRNFDLGAQRGLRDVHRYGAVQVVLLALEKRVVFDLEHHVQIAMRPAIRAGFAFLRQTHTDAIIHAGWNVHFELPLLLLVTLAVTLFARCADDLAGAAALAARAPHREETLLVNDLAAAMACRASGSAGAGLGALAAAMIAKLRARYLDLAGHAENRLFELNFEVVADILAALRPRTPPPAAAR